MATLTQPLRDEHRELLPHIETLKSAAEAVGEVSADVLRNLVDQAHEFLTQHLIPHAQAEDRVLYPVVGKALGAPEATATMSRDHEEVGRLTEELGSLRSRIVGSSVSGPTAHALRRVLYGLYALVKVHFAKEEEVYLPLLDQRLTPEEAQGMFKEMGHAAGEARGQEIQEHNRHTC